jgi:hypothetical protein
MPRKLRRGVLRVTRSGLRVNGLFAKMPNLLERIIKRIIA